MSWRKNKYFYVDYDDRAGFWLRLGTAYIGVHFRVFFGNRHWGKILLKDAKKEAAIQRQEDANP